MGCGSCTDCCKAIGVNKMSPKQESINKEHGTMPLGWQRISKREAKKRNPAMFTTGLWGSNKTYFKCNHLTEKGCEIHSTSPSVCSGYPYYGRSLDENKGYAEGAKLEYSPEGCSLWQDISEIEDENAYDTWLQQNFSNYLDRFSDRLHKSRSEFSDRLIPVINVE